MKHHIRNLLITGGIALTLAACGANQQSGAQTNGAASAAAAQTNAGGNRLGGRGIMGKIVSVNGSTLAVQDQRQSGTFTIDLTSSTQIFKQATVAPANVPVGQTISAFGTQDGTTFTATRVNIGSANSMGGAGGPGGAGRQMGAGGAGGAGRPGGMAQPNGTAQPNGSMPAGGVGQARQGRGSRLVGTVAQVAGDIITVKQADGTTTQLKLAANGEITQQVAGTSADIAANENIIAIGQRNGTTVTATQIDIVPAMAAQP